MIQALYNWFGDLSLRERWMVGVAAGLTLVILLVFAIIMPAISAIDRAELAHDEAVQRRGRIEATVAAALTQQPPVAQGNSADIDLVVTQGAAEKGFDLIKTANASPGQMSFRIDQARAPALLSWLNELEMQGIIAQSLTLRGDPNGSVTVEAELLRVSQ
ncbi:type II secretion system protein GspM [Sphingorhabdus sp.]|uniref:type II secretion system protein GspM n=1 Tax=Sphingorhabdus sp. TaxID=1902408 RepID=UPI00359476F9